MNGYHNHHLVFVALPLITYSTRGRRCYLLPVTSDFV